MSEQKKSMQPTEPLRLDTALVRRGFASGRGVARQLIESGRVQVNGKAVTKPSRAVMPEDAIDCDTSEIRFVGRGGYKLEAALDAADLSVAGLTALDVGASTGGFTDCLLQRGVVRVYAVDVGSDQLHPSLRNDPRVCCMEHTDMRDYAKVAAQIAPASIPLCVADVSFVSLKQLFPAVVPFLAADATVIWLIKPQFEAGRQAVGKHGVVKSEKIHRSVVTDAVAFFAASGWPVERLLPSPITGGDGNAEYLAVLHRGATSVSPTAVAAAVQAACAFMKIGR